MSKGPIIFTFLNMEFCKKKYYWVLKFKIVSLTVNPVKPSCSRGGEIIAFRFFCFKLDICIRESLRCLNDLPSTNSAFVSIQRKGSYSAGTKISIYVRFSMKNFNEPFSELTCCPVFNE